MSRFAHSIASLAILAVLAGCTSTPAPDYRIRVVTDEDGKAIAAVPPECPSWREYSNSRLENQFNVQVGCPSARNLAAQVDRKMDLIEGKPLGGSDGTYTAATINNYRAGKTKALYNAWSETPTISSPTGAGQTP